MHAGDGGHAARRLLSEAIVLALRPRSEALAAARPSGPASSSAKPSHPCGARTRRPTPSTWRWPPRWSTGSSSMASSSDGQSP